MNPNKAEYDELQKQMQSLVEQRDAIHARYAELEALTNANRPELTGGGMPGVEWADPAVDKDMIDRIFNNENGIY